MAKAAKAAKSGKKAQRTERRSSRSQGKVVELSDYTPEGRRQEGNPKPLKCMTDRQREYLTAIESKQLVFGVGPAGTGKTFVSTKWACQQLADRRVNQIILTRPAVESEEKLGFLPGTADEKVEPYFAPFRNIMIEHFGQGQFDCMVKNGRIVIKPLAFIRGDTFENAIVLLDEAQNMTVKQMKTFLTRIGKYTTVVVDGDTDQVDIKELSGLTDALTRFEDLPNSQIVTFTEEDIVRSDMVREILKRYRKTPPAAPAPAAPRKRSSAK